MFEGDIGGALLEAAERHAERPALWANGARLTYAELFDKAAGIATSLASAGVAPGERVAVLSDRTATAYAGILGALLAGCAYLPLNTIYPRARNQAMLATSGAAALVLNEACALHLDRFLDPLPAELAVLRPQAGPSAEGIGGRPTVPAEGAGENFRRSARRAAGADQLAYILFTSGSTGAPKGVPISHANLAAYLQAVATVGPLDPSDRVLQMAHLTFDLSVHDMFLTWLSGAELYSLPENAELLAPRMIAQHKLTACMVVPSPGARMLERGLAKPGSMPSLRLSYFCGEPLPRSLAAGWREAAPNSRIINIYGPTECTVVVCCYDYDPDAGADLPIMPLGRSFGTQKVGLMTPEMVPAGPGEPGEICIAGSQLMEGYWRDPALTAEKFATVDGERWYRTGDLGRWVEPHGFVFGGRADRQVKIRGYRVEMQELESVVRRVTGRREVAVIPWPINARGTAEGSVAFVGGEAGDAEAVRSGCRSLVAAHMVPDRVLFMPELPVNANGKIDYNLLARHPGLAG